MPTLPELLIEFYLFAVGACVGSFLNVVVYRLPRGISFVKGRSFCPACAHPLGAADLVPVFSRLFLGGRCRYCGARISLRYSLVETLGGVCAIVSVLKFGLSWGALFSFVFFSVIICISLIDADTMEIPNGLVLCLAVPGLFFAFANPGVTLLQRVIGFFVVSLPLYLLTLLIPDCFGGGDIKLIAAVGFLLGWRNTLLAAFVAILLGGGYGIYLLAGKKVKTGSHFAFGPFLCVGAAVAFLWGDKILDAYLRLF